MLNCPSGPLGAEFLISHYVSIVDMAFVPWHEGDGTRVVKGEAWVCAIFVRRRGSDALDAAGEDGRAMSSDKTFALCELVVDATCT